MATAWCHDEMLADDLVQDTLSKAIKNQQQLNDHIKLDAWLFRILHNTWMEHLRRYRPTTDLDDIDPLEERTPERNLSDQQIVDRVQQAILKLPVSQRQVVTLVDIEGSSYADVAEILAVPMGTVMSRLNRARNNLKKSLIGMRTKSAESAQVDYLRRVK
jgi:RNA polymerase sigma-70 factor (ECF subfamily)